jgi:hypothetical protein
MILDLNNQLDVKKFNEYSNHLKEKGHKVQLKKVVQNRSTRQNSSLHLYFTFISNELNNLGLEFQYNGINDNVFSLKYTPDLVKEFIWRPIQIAMFNIESTKQVNTNQINDIIDVITKFFSDRGVVLEFPSIENMINNYEQNILHPNTRQIR